MTAKNTQGNTGNIILLNESKKTLSVFAIDPGPKESGFVELVPYRAYIAQAGVYQNKIIESWLENTKCDIELCVEMVGNYGKSVGHEVFETCIQIGRFEKTFNRLRPYIPSAGRVLRREVALTLCGDARAKEPDVRQCIIDAYGGKDTSLCGKKCGKCRGTGMVRDERCIVCKKVAGWEVPPGDLKGVHTHAWSALAVALTYCVRMEYFSPLAANPGALDRNSRLRGRGAS